MTERVRLAPVDLPVGPPPAPHPSGPPVFRRQSVHVRVPATSANLGPGFDSYGLALGLYDDVVARVSDAGLAVEVVGEGSEALARDEGHLVVRSAYAAFDAMGARPPGLRLGCHNRVPHGRGLGSSSAAILAGLCAARALVEDGRTRLPDEALLRLATALEGHPDNVAAALLGGFTIAWTDENGPHAVRLDPVPGLHAVVLVPGAAVATVTARGLLPPVVPHGDAAANAARAGLLVEALTRRPELLLAATADRLHQDYRAPAMPATLALVDDLRRAGIAATVSGAGPSVLALVPDAAGVAAVVALTPGGFVPHPLRIEPRGAHVVPRSSAP